MDPLTPWIWSLALTSQINFQPNGFRIVPSGAAQIRRSDHTVEWSQLGRRSFVVWNSKRVGLQAGKFSDSFWSHAHYQRGPLRAGVWYDSNGKRLSAECQFIRPTFSTRFYYHPVTGFRVSGGYRAFRYDLGQRWNVGTEPIGALPRLRLAGGWSSKEPVQVEAHWRKVQVQYRSQKLEFGQLRTSWQALPGLHASAMVSCDNWRIQSSQRYQTRGKDYRPSWYLESSFFAQNEGIGGSAGIGLGAHRFYAAAGRLREAGGTYEIGLQTEGKLGSIGSYQFQGFAHYLGKWNVQVRVVQGVQLGNSNKGRRAAWAKLHLRLQSEDDGAQALVLLTEVETGQVVRLLLDTHAVKTELIPSGNYRVRTVGPEFWEYSMNTALLNLDRSSGTTDLIIIANKLIFKEMN